MKIRYFVFSLFISFMLSPYSLAMVCDDHMHAQRFSIDESNGYSFQIGFPANNGLSQRDPTGQYYMRLPAINPILEAYFADWNGNLILLRAGGLGPVIIGSCYQITSMQSPPIVNMPELTPGNYQVVGAPSSAPNIPQYFSPNNPGYINMVYAAQDELVECLAISSDKKSFLNCSVESLFPEDQKKIFKCVELSDDEREDCIAGTVLGKNEQRLYRQVQDCYEQQNGNIKAMPLCMAKKQFNKDTQQIIQCAEEQLEQGQFSAWGAIACVGGSKLKMNKEMTIAVQCAATSGGNPWVWAGCTGGQLTRNEIEKCFSKGVGGDDGCFGENNTIVQYLKKAGDLVKLEFGPTNDISIAFNNAVNDVSQGPGKNNDLVKAANTVINDLSERPGENNDVRKTLNQLLPGIW